MRNSKKLLTVVAFMLLAFAAITVFSGCKKEKEPYKPPVITTEYTVTYYDEDGITELGSQKFVHGSYITFPDKSKPGHLTVWTMYGEDGEEIGVDVAIQNTKAVVSYELMDTLVTIFDTVSGENVWDKYYYYGETFKAEEITVDLTNKAGFKYLGLSDDGGLTFKTEFALTDSITIEAVYEPIEYKIIYRDYDTSQILSEFIYKYTDGTYSLPGSTKEGYTFEGWFIPDAYAPGGVKKIGDKGTVYQITEEVTEFYAKYTKNETSSSDSAEN